MSDRVDSLRVTPLVGSAQPDELANPPAEEGTCEDDAARNAARLRADSELRDVLAADGFAGRAYALFEEELARYGYEVMLAGLAKGHIFIRCGQAGLKLRSMPIAPADVDDLAQETVAEALRWFKHTALQHGGWRPERGASLKTYFTRALYLQFANIWNKRLRAMPPRTARLVSLETLPFGTESPGPGPEDICLQRDEVLRGLAGVEHHRTRVALTLAEDGYEQEEIAEILGPDVTARAVEGYLRRHRNHVAHDADNGGRPE